MKPSKIPAADRDSIRHLLWQMTNSIANQADALSRLQLAMLRDTPDADVPLEILATLDSFRDAKYRPLFGEAAADLVRIAERLRRKPARSSRPAKQRRS